MKNIAKTVSLLTIISLIPAAFAATSRVSMITDKTTSRLPSIAGRLVSSGTTTTSSTTTYLNDQECLDKYTDCIKGADACGSGMEECTTNVLFHAQMPKCLRVLYQCTTAGVTQLFGTSSITSLSNVASYKTVGGAQEVDRYTYPTDGSALGQMIIGAAEANKLTKDQCVRRYTSCLKRDDICGEDFELCTTSTDFKKQAVLCDSTLVRCDNAGKTELYGSVAAADSLTPQGSANLSQMITDGAVMAASNAVLTCEKVVDNCLYNACVKNPWRCVTGTNTNVIDTADFVVGGTVELNTNTIDVAEVRTESQIRQMLKTQCLSKIGGNKYCHMTYLEKVPNNQDLVDVDLQEEVFALAYSDRKSAVNTKIQEAIKEFDKEAKDKCIDTIKSCAMRSCGGGVGSVCYKQSKLGSSTVRSTVSSSAYGDVHVNGDNTRGDIRAGCMAIVNADANCQYAAASASTDDSYTYTYTKDSVFDTLFPVYNETRAATDPIGAVSTLNALLATSYNEAAIATMKKQCETVALSCVKSMCGKDYESCYRARTDIVSGSYNTGNGKFDRSMNKVGGVLDYNIVMGLCMNTVKNSSVCEEHLKVATADWRSNADTESWGKSDSEQYSSVREGWLGANTTKENKSTYGAEGGILVACRSSGSAAASVTDAVFGTNMNCSGTMEPINGACVGVMDEDGCIYDTPVYMGETEYVLENAGKSLFQTLLVDVEKEVQAKYNAKLTKERNICLNENRGGVVGASSAGSTYQWVKLKGNKVPKSYVINGLQTKDFEASNDLYGSFCRMKVTVMSDDKDIQEGLGDSATAYFAIGDTFTCGSWIKSTTLQKVSETVGAREVCKQGYGKWENGKCSDQKASAKVKTAYAWATVAPALVAGIAGLGLTESGAITRWQNKANLKNGDASTNAYLKLNCKEAVKKAEDEADSGDMASANSYASSALAYCKQLDNNNNTSNCPANQINYGSSTSGVVASSGSASGASDNKNEFVTAVKAFKDRMENVCKNNDAAKAHCSNTSLLSNIANETDPDLANDIVTAQVKKCELALPTSSYSGISRMCSFTTWWTKNGTVTSMSTTQVATNNAKSFKEYLTSIENACDKATNKATNIMRAVLPTAMALGAGALGAGITASVIKTKKENIKNEAAQEWMTTVGDHIQCYVGSEEVGSYGDAISIELE